MSTQTTMLLKQGKSCTFTISDGGDLASNIDQGKWIIGFVAENLALFEGYDWEYLNFYSPSRGSSSGRGAHPAEDLGNEM